jgi:type II secretory pathway component GspD/PulD (secretin)
MRQRGDRHDFRARLALLCIVGLALGVAAWPESQLFAQQPAETAAGTDPAPAPTLDDLPIAPDADRRTAPDPADRGADVLRIGNDIVHNYACRFLSAQTLKTYVGHFIKGVSMTPFGFSTRRERAGYYVANTGTSGDTLIVKGRPDLVEQVLRVLDLIDRRPARLMIDVQIVETQVTWAFEYGFTFGIDRGPVVNTFFQSFNFNYEPDAWLRSLPTNQPPVASIASLYFDNTYAPGGTSATTFGLSSLTLRALQRNDRVKILANTRVMVDEGQEATISNGDQVYISDFRVDTRGRVTVTPQAQDAGTSLLVRAIRIGKRSVRLELAPSVKEVTGFTTASETQGSNPIIANRTASTLLTVSNGKTIVIGGLFQEENIVNTKDVPLLSKIPIIGEIFRTHDRSRSRTDISFIATPRVVHAAGDWVGLDDRAASRQADRDR